MEEVSKDQVSFLEDKEKVRKIFMDLAEVRQREAELKERRQTLEGIANAYFDRIPEAKVKIGQVGTFSRVVRTFYNYSPVVTTMEDEIKNIKKLEIEKGVAKVKSASKEIRFYAAKE